MYLFLMAAPDLLIHSRFGSPMHEQISLSISFGIDVVDADNVTVISLRNFCTNI